MNTKPLVLSLPLLVAACGGASHGQVPSSSAAPATAVAAHAASSSAPPTPASGAPAAACPDLPPAPSWEELAPSLGLERWRTPSKIVVAELDGVAPAEVVVIFSVPYEPEEFGAEDPAHISELWVLRPGPNGYTVLDHVDQEADYERWTGREYDDARVEAIVAPCRHSLWLSYRRVYDETDTYGIDLWHWNGERLKPLLGCITESTEYFDASWETVAAVRRATSSTWGDYPRGLRVTTEFTIHDPDLPRPIPEETFHWEGERLVAEQRPEWRSCWMESE